jgi:hypothetical protein
MATAKKAKAKGLASTVFTHTWKKGDKCAKMFYGIQGCDGVITMPSASPLLRPRL